MRLATQLAQDLTYGLRSMRRHVASSTTAIVVLALGIEANAAVFSVVNKALLEPLPFPSADHGSHTGQVERRRQGSNRNSG